MQLLNKYLINFYMFSKFTLNSKTRGGLEQESQPRALVSKRNFGIQMNIIEEVKSIWNWSLVTNT